MQLFRRFAGVPCEAALPEPHICRLFFSNRLMSNPIRGSEAARRMELTSSQAGRPAGAPGTLFAHPSIVLPFANPYIPWPPYFDYLSHFASSTLAITRRSIIAKFQKGKKRSRIQKTNFLTHDVMESRRRHWGLLIVSKPNAFVLNCILLLAY
jgi:hypothetical protein